MYFFDERSLALRTSEGWGPHFKEENLFALAVTPRGKVDRFDSDWITHADYDASGRLELGSYDRIDQYWRGIPASDQPAWELLCDGLAIVLDDDARKRAYEVVKREFPDCLLAIEISRLACETSGSPAGMITPWLSNMGDNTIDLAYWFRDEELREQDTIAALSQHPNSGNLVNLWHESDSIRLPGWGQWMTRFKLGSQSTPDLSCIASVHHVQ